MNRFALVSSAVFFLAVSALAQTSPAPVPAPTPKPLPQVEDRTVLARKAKAAADDFAGSVLDIVGGAYQIRYSVRDGLINERRNLGDFDLESIVKRSREYHDGLSEGRTRGESDGYSSGVQTARNRAHSIADQQIGEAIDRAIDTGRSPDFRPSRPKIAFSGNASGRPRPAGVSQKLSARQDSARREMQSMASTDLPSSLARELFDLRDLAAGDDLAVPIGFRDHSAFDSWMNNALSRETLIQTEVKRYYRLITSREHFQDPATNGADFRREFSRQYGYAIGDEHRGAWRARVQSLHSRAYNLGRDLYRNAALSYADELGQYEGYTETYGPASVRGFNSDFDRAYDSSYAQIENRVRTTSYITGAEVAAVNPSTGSLNVTQGDFIHLTVQKLVNRGMRDGAAVIQAEGSAAIKALKTEQIGLKGLTRLTAPAAITYFAQVHDVTQADQAIALDVRIGDQTKRFTLNAKFEEMVRRAAQLPADQDAYARFLMTKAAGFMKAQFDALSGFGDEYANRDPKMLLVRVRTSFDPLTDAEKVRVRELGQIVRDAFGAKPTRFLNPKRDEWDQAQAMISEMALAGTVPQD